MIWNPRHWTHTLDDKRAPLTDQGQAYLPCAIGRAVYLPIGNTRHHARLFCLHVGRSGRGRKGDAVSLVLRIDQALHVMEEAFAPQIHRGGLSSREGLQAIDRARDIAINQQSEMLIQGRNGQNRERNSYGDDPFPPKG